MTTNESTTTPIINWTNFKGQWMLRSNIRLTEGEFVTVTKKDGSTTTEKVGEYEKHFAAKDGMPEAHIFSTSI